LWHVGVKLGGFAAENLDKATEQLCAPEVPRV
jgi:hypothetical protein